MMAVMAPSTLKMGSELFSAYGCHFRSVSHYIDTVFAIDIKVNFVAV
jgi:hypothetical protein